mmetsp:Transcript_25282/g.24186  ORF Transcript_25282/g.24186 Transcript_25282/m.24186 type:complete len:171 (-) Transcript_25282:524-1036(-)
MHIQNKDTKLYKKKTDNILSNHNNKSMKIHEEIKGSTRRSTYDVEERNLNKNTDHDMIIEVGKTALNSVIRMTYSKNNDKRDENKDMVKDTGQSYTLMNGDKIQICDCRRKPNYAQKINTTSKYINSVQSSHIIECQKEGEKTVNPTGSKKLPTHAATSMRLVKVTINSK